MLAEGKRRLFLDELGLASNFSLAKPVYQDMFKRRSFWLRVRGERVLVFQGACLVCLRLVVIG